MSEKTKLCVGIRVYHPIGMYEVLEGPFKGERGPMIEAGVGGEWLTLSIPVGMLTIIKEKVRKIDGTR